MNSEQFTFWLQGFFELTDSNNLSPNQIKMIKEHLKLVFNKVTPEIKVSVSTSEIKPMLTCGLPPDTRFNNDSKAAEDLFPLSKEDEEKFKKLLDQAKEKTERRPIRAQGHHGCWAHQKIC